MPRMKSAAAEFFLNFDIDRYLNPWIPHNRLGRLPKPISHWLGYRHEPSKEPPSWIQWIWTFIATFLGILLVGAIYKYAPSITAHHPPVVVASLGASAILDYNAIRSPLAQPRNAVFGHALSAITGVAISKLFQLNPNFDDLQWVAGAVACAVASLTMTLTNTIHPPGGATAVLATTNATTIAMGWWFVPVLITGTLVQLGVALLINNIMRQYPIYWWTPANVGRKARRPEIADEEPKDEEKNTEQPTSEQPDSDTSSQRTLQKELSNVSFEPGSEIILLKPYHVQLPAYMKLSDDETLLLEKLQERLRTHGEVG